MLDENNYPDEASLKVIKEWDILTQGVRDVLDLVRENTNWADRQIEIRGKRVLYFEYHTGGWSGNEDVIDALHHNFLGNYPLKARKLPYSYCWDNPKPVGKHWASGWLTGIDNDLICVYPNVTTRVMEHWALSPTSHSRLLALIAFLAKRLLFAIDHNLRGL